MPSLPQPIIIVGAAPEIVVIAPAQQITQAIVERPKLATITDGLVSKELGRRGRGGTRAGPGDPVVEVGCRRLRRPAMRARR